MTCTQQRENLQSAIWKIANEVRGAVDGWDFKQFVLGTLFYRFINEILPRMSPLNPKYMTKKQNVFRRIVAFIEKFKSIGGEI